MADWQSAASCRASHDSSTTARDEEARHDSLTLQRTGISVSQAEADFADLQHEFTGVSRASRQDKEVDAEKAEVPSEKDGSVFDLEAALRGDLDAGLGPRHVGVYWDGLTVRGVGDTTNYMQTLPDVLVNLARGAARPLLSLVDRGRGRGREAEATLLRDFQVLCRPGEMVLVLGRPGAGCTTFLKAMANQRRGFMSVMGEVLYGPLTAREFERFRGEAVYSAEDDVHHATLTVEQTLGFALDCKMPARRPSRMSKAAFKAHVVDTLLAMFNMAHARHTPVGDEAVRGVSGGERKRVSIAEMMATRAGVLAWDNSTRGLDASTALDFARALRVLTDLYRTATFVSLYQASESMYGLFDTVLVVDAGRKVYFGPAAAARAHFEGLGFARAPRQATPDYLTACTDEAARRYAPGRSAADAPAGPDALAAAFSRFGLQARLDADMAAYHAALAAAAAAREPARRSVYQVGFYRQVWALARRQFALKLQDRFNLAVSWARSVLVAAVLGSLYLGLDASSASAFSRGGLFFISVFFNALQAFSEIAGTMLGRAVVDKYRAYAFHRPSALWIAQILVDQAFAASEIMVFSLIVYFMTGLARDAGAFFTFYLMILSGNVAMTLVFRIIGCLSPDFDHAVKLAVIFTTLFATTSGYIIQYQSEKPWLRWVFGSTCWASA